MITVCNVLIGHPVKTFDYYYYYYYKSFLQQSLVKTLFSTHTISAKSPWNSDFHDNTTFPVYNEG